MIIPTVCRRESKREMRRQAILAAAHDLFIEKGYEATTLGDIVGRSGGSLATLYEMFENKPGLLRAMVSEKCSVITETIDSAISAHRPPREALREVADYMFDKIVNSDSASLFQAVAAHPDLGRQLYAAGPATGQAKVAEYLALQQEEGVLDVEDPVFAAQMFFQMMFGHFHQRLIFGLPVKLTHAEKAAYLDRALDAFFKVYPLKQPRVEVGPVQCSQVSAVP